MTETNGHLDDRPLDLGPGGASDASPATAAAGVRPPADGALEAPASPEDAARAGAVDAAAPARPPDGEEVLLEFESPADASLAAEEAALDDLPGTVEDDTLLWHDEDAEDPDRAAASAEHAAELVAHAPRLEPIQAPEAPLPQASDAEPAMAASGPVTAPAAAEPGSPGSPAAPDAPALAEPGAVSGSDAAPDAGLAAAAGAAAAGATAAGAAAGGATAARATDAADARATAARAASTGTAVVRATGSWLDDRWGRLNATPEARRRMERILLGLVVLLAALVRFANLDKPGILVFDETFYVKDSWTLVRLGYEAKWPDGANEAWAAGNPNSYLAEGSYVVHPPLGKLVIGLGMLILGADSPWGWRISVAVLGTLLVAMVWFIGRRLFRSPVLATLAAGLVAVDGHAIVTSRITILDGVLAFFVVLGFWLFLIDRDDQRRKLAARIATWRAAHGLDGAPEPTRPSLTASAPEKAPSGPDWGPALWNRPWFMAAAVAFACASAVKWSGLYFLAAFCVYSLVVDMLERRRQGVTLWASAAVLKQGPVSFLLAIPLALATYLATWIPWFSTSNGFYRHWAEEPGHAWTGLLSWVPLPVQSLWHYQAEAFRFHTTLQASHPYQSAPWQWPFLIRPTAFSYQYHTAGDGSGCGVEQCVNAITSLSNPLIWWLGTAAILVLIVLQIARPTWRGGAILVGYAAGYAPWLAVFDRQAVFHFYAIVMLPFMALAIAEVARQLIGTNQDPRPQRSAATWTLLGVVALIAIVSAAFYPIWAGFMIPSGYWNLLIWLPGWR